MDSTTKAKVTDDQISKMVELANIKDVTKIEELKGGEFNLAYKIFTKNSDYILKIGPDKNTNTLKYEKGIMEIELWAYEEIKNNTNIKIPKIIFSSNEIIGNHWFIMSVIEESLFCDAKLTDEEYYNWQFQFGENLAELHNIKNEKFGYQQIGLHNTWKEAYYDMIFNLIEDAEKQGANLPDLANILRFIKKWDFVLDDVKVSRLVHYDLFSNNVFIDKQGNFAGLIDTERCFFGDYYADFFAIDFLGYLENNKGLIDGYNSKAEEKIEFTQNARARLALSRLMLGMIMFIEGTTRLELKNPLHWERKYYGSLIIDFALKEMD